VSRLPGLLLAIELLFGLTGPVGWAQDCPPLNPVRGYLQAIADCLAAPTCARQVAQEDLGRGCEQTVYVWARDPDRRFVVIRDLKMCQSRREVHDPQFVHGLLIPIEHVCGVEDRKLYEDSFAYLRTMWKLAWQTALRRLPAEEIALVVNAPTLRSEDHLHIHIVRRNGVGLPQQWVQHLVNLDDVWGEAETFARSRGITDRNYSILVCKSDGGFEMLVEARRPVNQQNPERKYTQGKN
jgi:CDP-diacylglycerol pyrophosphatase